MDTQHGNREIIELVEDMNATSGKHIFVRHGQRFSIEDDINRLFESIDIKTSARKNLQKQAMKRPVRADSCQASRIGITESTSLKQALRGLCISQASEMAAMKRLLSKPPSLSRGISEAVTIKRLYKAVVVEANESCNSGRPIRDGKLVEVSLVPENAPIVETLELTARPSLPMHNNRKASKMELGPRTNMNVKLSSISTHKKEKLPAVDEIVPTSGQERAESEFHYAAYLSTFNPGTDSINSAGTGPKLLKSIFRRKNLAKKKSKIASTSIVNGNGRTNEKSSNDLGPSTSTTTSKKPKTKADEKSRVREKGEFSQSSKSSVAECSSSNTSFSYESSLSSSNRSGCRPHMSRDSRWEAVRCVQKQHGSLDLRHFKLLKKLGGGDIGTVYLAELIGGSKCLFGLKVMDNEFLAQREKISRAETEREILQVLDHPFLPTLFGHFTNDKYMCLVMEYCPGGDLHVLRQKQLNKHFSEQAARFYVAEILLALEYLHMLGVVYRDLKPENVLVREDGHIMLTDFDLSLRCAPNQTFLKPSSPIIENPKKSSNLCTNSSCITPFCLQPSWQVQCFTPRLKSDPAAQVSPLPQLVVEPTTARSNSYVGTHEYLAPEIIKGEGHGSPVDWWTFGILLYELLYGRTPFKGDGNEDTLVNVVSKCLKFPESPTVSSHAKDLIKGLLRKQPEDRLGSVKGAAEIKQHPFFEGMNWALIRCAAPPELPRTYDLRRTTTEMASLHSEGVMCEKEFTSTSQNSFFEMF